MLLILASAAPVVAMIALFLTGRTSSRSQAPSPRRAPGGLPRLDPEGRWEALSREVARLERRRQSLGSDAAAHRRHLAAVLPADARR